MKQFYIFLFMMLTFHFSQAQPEILFTTQWKLSHLTIGSQSYIPVSNSEVVQISLDFSNGDFAPPSMNTSVCNTGFGSTEFSATEPTFFMDSFGRTLIMCNLPENESIEGTYFDFFSGNLPGIFSYDISYLLDFSTSPILTITNPVGDIAVYRDVNLAVNSFESSKFSISPNPATDQVKIDLGGKKIANAIVEIYDSSGKQIRTEKLSTQNTINVNDLSKGIYFLKLKTDPIEVSVKLIKK